MPKIVIDISEKELKWLKDVTNDGKDTISFTEKLILEGTPLIPENTAKRGRPTKDELNDKLIRNFRKQLQVVVKHKLDEINHYIAGVDSPFTYMQISDVQERLVEIADILNLKEVSNGNSRNA